MSSFLMMLVLLLPSSARSLPDSAQTCLGCHSDAQTAPVPDLKGFDKSAHSGLDCAACHRSGNDDNGRHCDHARRCGGESDDSGQLGAVLPARDVNG